MPLLPASDPVTAAYNTAVAILSTAEEIGKLIARLGDRKRTLEEAEAERRKQSERLDK